MRCTRRQSQFLIFNIGQKIYNFEGQLLSSLARCNVEKWHRLKIAKPLNLLLPRFSHYTVLSMCKGLIYFCSKFTRSFQSSSSSKITMFSALRDNEKHAFTLNIGFHLALTLSASSEFV